MKELWKKQMQKKLDGYKMAAPELDWTNVYRRVEDARKTQPKVAAVSFWPRRVAAAAAILLLMGGAGYLVYRQPPTSPMETADMRPASPRQNPHAEADGTPANPVRTVVGNILYAMSGNGQKASDVTGAVRDSVSEPGQPLVAMSTENPKGDVSRQDVTVAAKEKKLPSSVTGSATDSYPPDQGSAYTQRLESSGHGLMARVYASGGLGGNASVSSMGMLMNAMPIGDYCTYLGQSNEMTNITSDFVDETHAKHHQPIRFGVSVRYPLNDRWSVDVGLAYTRISSDITHRIGGTVHYIDQTLQYMGLPVNLNYSLWSNRRFNVYASTGAMVEKMVKGKARTTTEESHIRTMTTDEKVILRPLQYSVNAAVGAEIKLGDHQSIYAEPGIGYYFDNKSKVQTLYQDKPLNLNINVGVRFNLK
jgi:hypothetical protein